MESVIILDVGLVLLGTLSIYSFEPFLLNLVFFRQRKEIHYSTRTSTHQEMPADVN